MLLEPPALLGLPSSDTDSPQSVVSMISVSGLSKFFGDRILFADASFQLNPGERYGLVGANGSGKTTLLSILAGDLDASDGTVSIPKRLQVGVLRQDQFLYEERSVLSAAMMGNEALWTAMDEKERILANAEVEFDADRFSELEEIVQQHDGYTAEARAATILEGLGLPAEVHQKPLSTLSGGFKLRVLLAQVLAGSPDVLFLDEPTNHLDILSIRWLEKFLREFSGPAVVISHDHRFLDNVASHILDVDYETVLLYTGNYSRFVEAKQAERVRREKDIAGREKEIAHHQKFVDRFKAKASKARQAGSKMKLIEKQASALQELPQSSRRYPTFRFKPQRPSGRDVLKIEGVRKAFGDNEVLHGVDLLVRRGERIAIMGPNGIGKSTLLKIVMGQLEADAGEVEWGYETHPGYFAQDHRDQLSQDHLTAEQWLLDYCPGRKTGIARAQLGMVLFSGDDVEKRLSALSGGEAARLIFSHISLKNPNVLVLDEPTNHLDLESIEALVEGLKQFDGTLLFVSHDRWFVSQLANRVVEISADRIRDYLGTYEEYVHDCGDDHLDVDTVVLKAQKDKRVRRPGGSDNEAPTGPGQETRTKESKVVAAGLSKNQVRQLERRREKITLEIESHEGRTAEIDELFCQPSFYDATPPDDVRRFEEERSNLVAQVERLMEEWEALEEQLTG